MRYLLLPLVFLGFLTPAARADNSAAGIAMAGIVMAGIVMESVGDSDPHLSAMTEIPADASFQLKPGVKLTFLHYARCKLVTVTGGTLTVTRAGYTDAGGTATETDGPCPRVYSLPVGGGEGHGAGGLISRGVAMPPRWPTRPDIILTGARANGVAAAAILADGQPARAPVSLNVADRRVRAPQGASPLQPNGRYTLRLTIRDRRDPVDIPFVATGGLDSLVVLRVD